MNRKFFISFFFFALILILVSLQFIFQPFKLVGLSGSYTKFNSPEFSFSAFTKGNYQKKVDYYATTSTPFRGDLVRLKNQIGYTLFNEINTNLILGKENYLFDPNYTNAFTGKDLFSHKIQQQWEKDIQQLSEITQENGIIPIFIIAPNKSRYFESHLPQVHKKGKTNQEVLAKMLLNHGINVFNVDDWFMLLKNKVPYPLIPPHGAHWSDYGVALVSDSLNQLLQKSFNGIPEVTIGPIEVSNKAKGIDGDYLPSLNLIQKFDSPLELAYPQMIYSKGKKLNTLVLSDSFMWNLFRNDFFKAHCKASSLFSYYNNATYNLDKERINETAINFKANQLKQFEVLIIIATGPSIKEGFAYSLFNAEERGGLNE